MKLLLFTIFLFPSLTYSQISLSDQFDHGNTGTLKEVKPNYFRGQTTHWIKKDKIGNQYYWFYFKAEGVKGKKVTFQYDNMTGFYRGKHYEMFRPTTAPVFSYDNKIWHRITEHNYNKETKSFVFSQDFEKNTVWIAYAHPYDVNRKESLISSIKGNKNVQISSIGSSLDNNKIDLIKIGNNNIKKEKKNILLFALQHPGEDCGAHFLEGAIDYLINNKEADALLEKFNFFFVPMVNPDGVFYGTSRYSLNMSDLNSEWFTDSVTQKPLTKEPEVLALMKLANKIKPDLVFDIHSHGQHHFGNSILIHGQFAFNNIFYPIAEKLSKSYPVRVIPNKIFQGTAKDYFDLVHKVPSCTFELTQSQNFDKRYIEEQDYLNYGKELMKVMGQISF